MGRPYNDDRLMLSGILWVLCSGTAWRNMPERLGAWSKVYQQSLIDLNTWMIQPYYPACSPSRTRCREKGLEDPTGHAMGRCRDGLTTKIHMLCDCYRIRPVIPLRDMKRKLKPGLPRSCDRLKCKQRNAIERMFAG